MDTIDAILQAAYEEFSARGFERTPVSDIARKAGVAAGTIIYHFKTKENLLKVLNWFTINQLYAAIRQRTLTAATGQEAVSFFVAEFFAYLAGHSREMALLLQTFPKAGVRDQKPGHRQGLDSPDMNITIRTVSGGLEALLEDLIAQGVADGSIVGTDPRQAGLGIMALVTGSAHMALVHGLPQDELMAAAAGLVTARLKNTPQ